MTIRKAKIHDLPQLTTLFNAYRVFYKKDPDPDGAKEFLWERISQNDSEIFVCEEGDYLVGFVQLYPVFTSTNMKKLWLLNDLFVKAEYRGKGFSKSLISRAKELAKDTYAYGLILETEKSNHIGNSLYPEVGFVLNTTSNFYEWINNSENLRK